MVLLLSGCCVEKLNGMQCLAIDQFYGAKPVFGSAFTMLLLRAASSMRHLQ
jgi:hypothetical protein